MLHLTERKDFSSFSLSIFKNQLQTIARKCLCQKAHSFCAFITLTVNWWRFQPHWAAPQIYPPTRSVLSSRRPRPRHWLSGLAAWWSQTLSSHMVQNVFNLQVLRPSGIFGRQKWNLFVLDEHVSFWAPRLSAAYLMLFPSRLRKGQGATRYDTLNSADCC